MLSAARITATWKDRSQSGKLSKYAVRRYFGTKGGVFLTYPGTAMERTYEPSKRDWYRNALKEPGTMIFTAPYLDVGGAGYVVTLSHAIYKRKLVAFVHSTFEAAIFHVLIVYIYFQLLTIGKRR